MVVWVELVSMGGLETGGVTVIVYISPPPFGGGVHMMVTVESVVPFTSSVSLTSLGGSVAMKRKTMSTLNYMCG